MKKSRKHHFTHTDPEGIKVKDLKIKDEGKVKTTAPNDNLSFIKKDLSKTALIISLFLLLLISLYFIQIKTNLLSPILRLFGL